MSVSRKGPPEMEAPGPARPGQLHDTPADSPKFTRDSAPRSAMQLVTARAHAQDVSSQLRRRRDAAHRVVPLDCGCPDGWICDCTSPPLTDRWVDAGRDAALHLLAQGLLPRLELEVLRALYRRGGRDRRLAQRLHAATGGTAA